MMVADGYRLRSNAMFRCCSGAILWRIMHFRNLIISTQHPHTIYDTLWQWMMFDYGSFYYSIFCWIINSLIQFAMWYEQNWIVYEVWGILTDISWNHVSFVHRLLSNSSAMLDALRRNIPMWWRNLRRHPLWIDRKHENLKWLKCLRWWWKTVRFGIRKSRNVNGVWRNVPSWCGIQSIGGTGNYQLINKKNMINIVVS